MDEAVVDGPYTLLVGAPRFVERFAITPGIALPTPGEVLGIPLIVGGCGSELNPTAGA